MGFLNRLFGKKPEFENRVWRTSALKFDDLGARLAAEREDERIDALVIHHFAGTGENLESRLEALDPSYKRLNRPGTESFENLRDRTGASLTLLASDEIPEEIKRGQASERRSSEPGSRRCHVHLAEHFPMPYRDDHVLNLHALLPSESRFFVYAGLDEAWLGDALGDTTLELLEKLGISDDEPLSHPLIDSALRRTQEQLAQKQRGVEHNARSSEEWMERNITD